MGEEQRQVLVTPVLQTHTEEHCSPEVQLHAGCKGERKGDTTHPVTVASPFQNKLSSAIAKAENNTSCNSLSSSESCLGYYPFWLDFDMLEPVSRTKI